ncbi:MAG: hypothetical protein ACFB10_08110 [Salibacteraceae bacterium]
MIILLLSPFYAKAQEAPSQEALNALLNDGIELYQLELASTYASSFLDGQLSTEDLAGFFSYKNADTIRTLFYEKNGKVRYEFAFGLPVKPSFAYLRGDVRKMDSRENLLLKLRKTILKKVKKEEDYFGSPQLSGFNLNFLERAPGWVAYLTPFEGEKGKVPLGSDFILRFSEKGKLLSYEKLHQNLITIQAGNAAESDPNTNYASMHLHSQASSAFITPTDICQLLLYKDQVTWVEHYVVSQNFVCLFRLDTLELILMTPEEFQQLQED